MPQICVSFEIFPPAEPLLQEALWRSIRRLAPLAPTFISVTCGADGSTRDRTFGTVTRLPAEAKCAGAAHLTCVGASRREVLALARAYWDSGIRHIVALRGDPPGGGSFAAHPEGFASAAELVLALRELAPFEISVAAYPEVHPDAHSADADLEALRAKTDAGAHRAITQFFFDTDVFLRFRDRCASRGIAVPIVPGILPITRFAQVLRMAERCRTSIPSWLRKRFEGLDGEPDTQRLIAASVAIDQVTALQRAGVEAFHFYTLNRADLTYAVCHALGVRPRMSAEAAPGARELPLGAPLQPAWRT